MRTSGADQDTGMVMIPVGVLVVFATFWLGGPSETLRLLNEIAVEGLSWLTNLLR